MGCARGGPNANCGVVGAAGGRTSGLFCSLNLGFGSCTAGGITFGKLDCMLRIYSEVGSPGRIVLDGSKAIGAAGVGAAGVGVADPFMAFN
tara:strand:- start:596 stop:868 length:273 start_codon:yes stop_codon:yes gene_type:complete